MGYLFNDEFASVLNVNATREIVGGVAHVSAIDGVYASVLAKDVVLDGLDARSLRVVEYEGHVLYAAGTTCPFEVSEIGRASCRE